MLPEEELLREITSRIAAAVNGKLADGVHRYQTMDGHEMLVEMRVGSNLALFISYYPRGAPGKKWGSSITKRPDLVSAEPIAHLWSDDPNNLINQTLVCLALNL